MKTLLIDNYDSFTFNLYQLLAQVNGTPPEVVRNDQPWEEVRALGFDNVVLSPGPGRPERPEDFGNCRRALLEADVPILGVCLGHQGIGHVFGATLQQAPTLMHGRCSEILHDGAELFRGIPQAFSAVRYHSLVVSPELPACLERTAWTADGLVMALRHRVRPIWGVQFHPESICSQHGRTLLENFRDLTRARGRRPAAPAAGGRRSAVVPGGHVRREQTAYQLHTRALALPLDPEQVFFHLYGAAPRAFWLDSNHPDPKLCRFSFLGDDRGPESMSIRYRLAGTQLEITHDGQTTVRTEGLFAFLEHELAQRYIRSDALPFDFNGGFVGYLGYELKAGCGGDAAHRSPHPDAQLILADRLIAFDHQTRTTYLVCLARRGEAAGAERWLEEMESRLRRLPPLPPPDFKARQEVRQEPLTLSLSRGREVYLRDIAECFARLRDGDSYEICLCNTLSAEVHVEPLDYYRALRRINAAPYSAFLRFDGVAIACSSPERFLRIDREGRVESKPIKGTARRGATPEEDARLAERLRASEKDRAENLMIVDLLRNDLSRVCEVGSVHVPKLMEVESYATVHQLLSTIRGQLRSDLSTVACVQAAFPGGSMTGAPKRSTMRIIDALEGEARGIYSGAIGFLGLGGGADLNIVIRTAVIEPGRVSIGVGGAIVALSSPEEEFDELLLKGEALSSALRLLLHGRADAPYRLVT